MVYYYPPMNNLNIPLDIIVYAVIAVLLLGRLWFVLGTRNDSDTQRPNPFTPQPTQAPSQVTPSSNVIPLRPSFILPPASLAGGLAQVAAIDPNFQEKLFLQKARDIFTVVVAAYAANNMASINEFLSPDLAAHFQKMADARASQGQSAQSRVASIQDAEVIAARSEAEQAYVTVQFISHQENILRDASGTIIGGTEGQLEQVTDIWVFSRNAQMPDGKWIVVETRG